MWSSNVVVKCGRQMWLSNVKCQMSNVAASELMKTLDQEEILFSVQSATAILKKYNTIISHGFYHSQLCTALLSTGLSGQLGPS
jgi:hypothetical protein